MKQRQMGIGIERIAVQQEKLKDKIRCVPTRLPLYSGREAAGHYEGEIQMAYVCLDPGAA
jgi:hypothetical protein